MSIQVSVTALADITVPAATVVVGVQFTVTPAAGGQAVVDNVATIPSVGESATFAITTPGTYNVTAQAYDNSTPPVLLGAPVTATVVIPVPTTITISVPSAIAAVVA